MSNTVVASENQGQKQGACKPTPLMRLIALYESVHGRKRNAELAAEFELTERTIERARAAMNCSPITQSNPTPVSVPDTHVGTQMSVPDTSVGTPVSGYPTHTSVDPTPVSGRGEGDSRARIESPSGILSWKENINTPDRTESGTDSVRAREDERRRIFERSPFGRRYGKALSRAELVECLSESVGEALRNREQQLDRGVALVQEFLRHGLTLDDVLRVIRSQVIGKTPNAISSWSYFRPGLAERRSEHEALCERERKEAERAQRRQAERRLHPDDQAALDAVAQRYTGPQVPPGYVMPRHLLDA